MNFFKQAEELLVPAPAEPRPPGKAKFSALRVALDGKTIDRDVLVTLMNTAIGLVSQGLDPAFLAEAPRLPTWKQFATEVLQCYAYAITSGVSSWVGDSDSWPLNWNTMYGLLGTEEFSDFEDSSPHGVQHSVLHAAIASISADPSQSQTSDSFFAYQTVRKLTAMRAPVLRAPVLRPPGLRAPVHIKLSESIPEGTSSGAGGPKEQTKRAAWLTDALKAAVSNREILQNKWGHKIIDYLVKGDDPRGWARLDGALPDPGVLNAINTKHWKRASHEEQVSIIQSQQKPHTWSGARDHLNPISLHPLSYPRHHPAHHCMRSPRLRIHPPTPPPDPPLHPLAAPADPPTRPLTACARPVCGSTRPPCGPALLHALSPRLRQQQKFSREQKTRPPRTFRMRRRVAWGFPTRQKKRTPAKFCRFSELSTGGAVIWKLKHISLHPLSSPRPRVVSQSSRCPPTKLADVGTRTARCPS